MKRARKIHYRVTTRVGSCGYYGETTEDRNKVTCKLCKKLLATGKYLY
jgi:hypothetical protein